MIVTLQHLLDLHPKVTCIVSHDGSTITIKNLPHINDGQKGIKCSTGWSLSAFERGSATFNGPMTYDRQEQVINRCGIQFDVQEQAPQSGAMAKLRPVSTRITIPAPVLEGDNMTATICVATSHASSLPDGATVISTRGGCTIAQVTVNINGILVANDRSLCLSSVLQFTFHRDIAEEAMHLLNQAHEEAEVALGRQVIHKRMDECAKALKRDEQRCRKATAVQSPSPFSLSWNSPSPMFSDGSKSTGIWADDADVASTPSQTNFHRDVEATAFSGIQIIPSRKERKAMEKAQLAQEKAQRKEEEEAKRQAMELEAQRKEQQRRKDLEDIARAEQEQQKAEAMAQQEKDINDALMAEFTSFDPVALIAVDNPTLEQFLANPQALRDAIADVMSGTAQDCSSTVQEEGPYPILAQTPRLDIVENFKALAKDRGFPLHVIINQYATGPMYNIDITALVAAGVCTLRVSAWGNEIVVGELTDDGTLKWGTCMNVKSDSYNALMSIFPEMSDMVQQVMATRAHLKIRKPQQHRYQHPHLQQGLLPTPMHVLPVFDVLGRVVAFQQMQPPFAWSPSPSFFVKPCNKKHN